MVGPARDPFEILKVKNTYFLWMFFNIFWPTGPARKSSLKAKVNLPDLASQVVHFVVYIICCCVQFMPLASRERAEYMYILRRYFVQGGHLVGP